MGHQNKWLRRGRRFDQVHHPHVLHANRGELRKKANMAIVETRSGWVADDPETPLFKMARKKVLVRRLEVWR